MVAAGGAVVLLISLFLDWYEFKVPAGGPNAGRSVSTESAWGGLERTDLYLCILAIAALIGVAVLLGNWIRDSNATQITVLLIGLAALFLVIYRGTSPPAPVIFGVELDTTLKLGWFLALLSSAAIAVGGGMAVIRRPLPDTAEADTGTAAPGATEPGAAAPGTPEPAPDAPRSAEPGPGRTPPGP
jgi:hypothetical protein